MKMIDIQKAFYRHTFQRYEIVAPNIFLNWDNELDLVGVRKSGYIDEIEIKITKQDYLADYRKVSRMKSEYYCYHDNNYKYKGYCYINKHKLIQRGKSTCNYFSFLLHEDLVGQCDIPEYSGLYVWSLDKGNMIRVKEVKKAPRLHTAKISEQKKYHIGRKMAYRFWNKVA